MASNKYIHYHASNVGDKDSIMSMYNQQKINETMDSMKRRFRRELKNLVGGTAKENQILLDEIQKGIKQGLGTIDEKKILTSGFKVDLKSFGGQTPLGAISKKENYEELIKQSNDYQKYIEGLEKVYSSLNVIFKNEDQIDSWLTNFILTNQDNLNTETFNKAKDIFYRQNKGNLIKTSPGDIHNNQELEKKMFVAKTQIELLKKQSHIKGNLDFFKSINSTLLYNINALVGFAYEPIVQMAIDQSLNNLDNKLNDLVFSITSAGRLSSNVKYAKNKKNLVTKKIVNKADLNISVSQKELSGQVNIMANIPGISIKAYNYNPNKKATKVVSIQTGSTFKQVINRGQLSSSEEYGLINILGHAEHTEKYKNTLKDVSLYNKQDRLDVYSFLKVKNVLNALVGTMQPDDFSYYFVANTTVYSMKDILNKIAKNPSILTHTIEPAQSSFIAANEDWVVSSRTPEENAEVRSKKAYEAIMSAKFNMKLKLDLIRS